VPAFMAVPYAAALEARSALTPVAVRSAGQRQCVSPTTGFSGRDVLLLTHTCCTMAAVRLIAPADRGCNAEKLPANRLVALHMFCCTVKINDQNQV
jgi:hypothetical protein